MYETDSRNITISVLPDYTGSEIRDGENLLAGGYVYPNPAEEMNYINFTSHVTGKVHVSIFNVQGKCVDKTIKLVRPYEKRRIGVSLTSLDPGIYYYCIREKGKTAVYTFIKD